MIIKFPRPFSRMGVVAFLGAVIFLGVLIFGLYLPLEKSPAQEQEFVVQEGDGLSKIARLLTQADLIRSRSLFWLYIMASGTERDLKAGHYLFSRGMNMLEIAEALIAGRAEPDDLVTVVPEGFNTWDIDRRLAEMDLIKAGDFFKSASIKEGFLFPDTYRLKKSQNSQEIIDELILKMKVNFDEKDEIVGLATWDQIVVASILEKEVQNSEDMALVAGIIYKRLDLKMLLQIDASVAYGACLNGAGEEVSPYLSRRVFCDVSQVNLIKWIKIDGPYNTYMRSGLPEGPISNPGSQAINASLHSQTSDYLYYLSARDGRTIFSKTAGEHERNRAEFLGL